MSVLKVRDYLTAHRTATVGELCRETGLAEGLVHGALDFLIRKGQAAQEMRPSDFKLSGCSGCSLCKLCKSSLKPCHSGTKSSSAKHPDVIFYTRTDGV